LVYKGRGRSLPLAPRSSLTHSLTHLTLGEGGIDPPSPLGEEEKNREAFCLRSVSATGRSLGGGIGFFYRGDHSPFFPRQLRERGGIMSCTLLPRSWPLDTRVHVYGARVHVPRRICAGRTYVTPRASRGTLRVTRRPSYMESRERGVRCSLGNERGK
jgi:hypothetical protein